MVIEKLLKWFEKNHREFPWQQCFKVADPYGILLAEVMFQRTQAKQVATVYSNILSRYPILEKLCEAPESEIKTLLKPLGLNHRIQKIVDLVKTLKIKYKNKIPCTYEELRKLPAVGEYVATAVMIYAYGEDAIALDANVMRILSRIFGIQYKLGYKPTKELRDFSKQIVPKGKSKEFNLCLLDFGALICTQRKPMHASCPVKSYCIYYKQNIETDYKS